MTPTSSPSRPHHPTELLLTIKWLLCSATSETTAANYYCHDDEQPSTADPCELAILDGYRKGEESARDRGAMESSEGIEEELSVSGQYVRQGVGLHGAAALREEREREMSCGRMPPNPPHGEDFTATSFCPFPARLPPPRSVHLHLPRRQSVEQMRLVMAIYLC